MTREDIITWCRKQYGAEPDYPWNDNNAVLRHKKAGKWFEDLLEVRRDRLGVAGEEMADVLNVKSEPVLIGSLRMREGFLTAYHMNKENWISILFEKAAPDDEIKNLIELSFQMTLPKNSRKP
ncbi:MAG: MmcQ/YjbR family DNA-binding protein [Lachnospiraceae bacterium]|nr:MmcQ/YjbR family DNA-binding protein [Lachnospiraceae bacterium]